MLRHLFHLLGGAVAQGIDDILIKQVQPEMNANGKRQKEMAFVGKRKHLIGTARAPVAELVTDQDDVIADLARLLGQFRAMRGIAEHVDDQQAVAAGIGGLDLPLEVSAIDSIPSVTDDTLRSLSITARREVSLNRILLA